MVAQSVSIDRPSADLRRIGPVEEANDIDRRRFGVGGEVSAIGADHLPSTRIFTRLR